MDNPKRLKIAYYSINDPLDKRSWSGITYYLGRALQKNIGDVDYLGPVEIPWLLDKLFRALQKTSRLLFRSEWIPKYSLAKNAYAALVLKRRMRGKPYDLLLAPAAAPELALLRTRVPIVYFGDATFKIYSSTYEKEFRDCSALTKWEGNYLENSALKKSRLVILASRWAARSAVADYGVPEDKVVVILLGANMDEIPAAAAIYQKQQNKTLTLLFLAVDWDRKGGEIAFETLQRLLSLGHEAKLIVCGCVPPARYTCPEVEVVPFIDKNRPEDQALFRQILLSAHFLLVPTRADCSLLVAMEANAYGIPAITTDVGGVGDVVTGGINGYCLPPGDRGERYAALIAEIYSDQGRYRRLMETSRARFESDLNWDKWAARLKQELFRRGLPGG